VRFRPPYKFVLVAWLFLAALICVDDSSSQTRGGLGAQEIRGKQVYVKGESGESANTAMLGNADLEVPASSFSCSNCHGRRGEGTREGGLQPTPIDWETLTRPLNTPYPPQHP
jgi:hypothetical protein